jgi:phage shock protein C
MSKQLYRSKENKILAGVCAGIAEYFEIDPTIVRIIWLLSIFTGIGIIAYLICWLIMPEKSFSPFKSSADSSEAFDTKETSAIDKDKSKRILGIALIIIGSLFMLDKFFRWFNMDLIIPLGIIAVGIYILFNTRRG